MNDLFSVVAVIATVLSVVFAFAALSISRKKQMRKLLQMQHQQQINTAKMAEPRAAVSAEIAAHTEKPAPPQTGFTPPTHAAAQNPMPFTTTSPLFKKLSTHGIEEAKVTTMDQEQYIWE